MRRIGTLAFVFIGAAGLLACLWSCSKENTIDNSRTNTYSTAVVCQGPTVENAMCGAAPDAPPGAFCVYGYCRTPCTSDAQCEAVVAGSICLPGADGSGCRLPQEADCGGDNLPCSEGLVCADGACRARCSDDECWLQGLACVNGTCLGSATGQELPEAGPDALTCFATGPNAPGPTGSGQLDPLATCPGGEPPDGGDSFSVQDVYALYYEGGGEEPPPPYYASLSIVFTNYANACGYVTAGVLKEGGLFASISLGLDSPTSQPTLELKTYGAEASVGCNSLAAVSCDGSSEVIGGSATDWTITITAYTPGVEVQGSYDFGSSTGNFTAPICNPPVLGEGQKACCVP